MYVEIVVGGQLGALAVSAFPELVVERRPLLVTPETHALAALEHLTRCFTDVVFMRLRDDSIALAAGGRAEPS